MIDKLRQVKNSVKTGRFGEEIAFRYFAKKGYELVRRNYHIQGGELDLILKKNGIIVFVEVKLRTNPCFGAGVEALTRSKKQKLLRSVFTFLQSAEKSTGRTSRWRMDLLDIRFDKTTRTAFIQHFPNIFEA